MRLRAVAAKRRVMARALRAHQKAENIFVRRMRASTGAVLATLASAALNQRTDAIRTRGHDRVEAALRATSEALAANTSKHVRTMFDSIASKNARALKALGIPIGANAQVATMLPDIVQKNVSLIRKNVEGIAEEMLSILSDPENIGLSNDALAALIQERVDVGESRAVLIARDQTTKLNGAINSARQQSAGVEKFIWSTSGDERVREEHADLDGQTFSWDSLPSEGAPGDAVQCRCVAIPVIDELEGLDL